VLVNIKILIILRDCFEMGTVPKSKMDDIAKTEAKLAKRNISK